MSKNAPPKVAEAAALPLETATDLFRFTLGAAVELQKRALDLASRQHALSVKAASDLVGLYDEAVKQSFADGQSVLAASAARARSAFDGAFARWAEPAAV